MSDRPIQVGDLVMIVGCTNQRMMQHLGKIGAVLAPSKFYDNAWLVEGAEFSTWGVPCSWRQRHLKRLDPDALKDDVPTREELTA